MIFRNNALKAYFTAVFLCAFILTQAQFTTSTIQTFNSAGSFIENKGQYGKTYKKQEAIGTILFGFEGHDMPILFTKKGVIFLQRKVESISNREKEKLEKQGLSEEKIEHKKIITDRVITMEWLGANENVEILQEEKTDDYHTYGLIQEKAFGYKKITFKNLYNGIDLVYYFTNNSKIGFEYSLQVSAGADVSQIKMQYGGDAKNLKLNKEGNLIINSDIEDIQQSIPITYYAENVKLATNNEVITKYRIKKNTVSFLLNEGYDNTRPIIIDPFVSNTNNIDGANAGKAKDIDFDYAGNLYVTGGGSVSTNHRLAKYNAAGILQWTFSGLLTSPLWEFGYYMGGWVVDKPSGNIYLGQGYADIGFRVVRLKTNGLYDNYVSTTDINFQENWKMAWSCNNGSPQILAGGGGTSSNINLGVLTPPSTTVSSLNITGSNEEYQDIADILIDPLNNRMYTIFASGNDATNVNNRIYCNSSPYAASSILWDNPSGYTTLNESRNRPYLFPDAGSFTENSANILALNTTYLFYWDGKNLRAFNKSTGAVAGSLTLNTNTVLMSGGILADPLNNLYIGNKNGTITSYTFNGNTFIPNGNNAFPNLPKDIIINGFSTKSVYDLAYNEAKGKIYACGNGFVAAYDVSVFGNTTAYSLNITTNCTTGNATATLVPTPPAGSVVTYVLYDGTTQLMSNTTGIFTGIMPSTNYTVIATLNAACSGTQTIKNFSLVGPTITTTTISENCGNATGQIMATGSGTIAPYTYSINGLNYFPSGTFTGLVENTYTVTAIDGNGCITTKQVVVGNNSFTPTFVITSSGTNCSNSSSTINITTNGGVGPYQYSLNNGLTYQNNNIFSGIAPGQYKLKVKDFSGCLSTTVMVNITPAFVVGITALSTNSTCGLSNGKITATPIGGTSPYEYSINGGTTYQPSNIFTGLLPGTYSIKIRDANTCTNTTAIITVDNTPGPSVTAVSENATCGNNNGKITALPNGQNPPFKYSINGGITHQNSPNFTNLAPMPYTVSIKDNNNCVSSFPINIMATPIPILNVFAGSDTAVIIKQPLQLNAIDINNAGFVSYAWSPPYGLNRPNIKNPISILERDYSYEVVATTADGCVAKDSINIKITFKSEIYVPSGFTPNGDGFNDVFRPILIGIKSLKYFSVYNRFGQLIYKSDKEGDGWDGKIKGELQPIGTYVWMLEATDYKDNTFFKKGTILLIK